MAHDTVECSAHGSSPLTLVCEHAAVGHGVGFEFDPESTEPWPDAVCTACANEPEWTDEVVAERMRVLCAKCWEDAFERNASAPVPDEMAWLTDVFKRAKKKQDRWLQKFAISNVARFRYCFDPGEAWLAFGDAESFRVRCDAHVIGSWSKTSGTWLWGWANDHWDARVTEAIVRVKRRGEREGVRALTRSVFEADEATGWELACAVLDTMPEIEGVYRSPGDTNLFLAATRTRWAS